jgi:hypothetical protein
MMPAAHRTHDRRRDGGVAFACWNRSPARDAVSMIGQSLAFASMIGCLFGILMLLARLL